MIRLAASRLKVSSLRPTARPALRCSPLRGGASLLFLLALLPQVMQTSAQEGPGGASATAVHGQVTAGDGSRAPQRRARVIAATADGSRTSPPVFTDDEGRFALVPTFSPPFTVTVTRPGFAPQAVAVAAASAAHDLGEIALPRGGVISGRVLDAMGNPATAEITLLPVAPAASPVPAPRQRNADDRGEFRFGSLPAGEYHVYVDRSARMQLETTRRLQTAASERGVPDRAAAGPSEAMARALRDSREVPPDAIVLLQAGGETALSLRKTVDLTDALWVAAALGSAPAVPLSGRSTIRGRILDSAGSPVALARVELVGEQVSRSPDAGAVVSMRSGVLESTVSDGAGRYQFTALPAGTYGLRVQRVGYEIALAGVSAASGPQRGTIPLSGDFVEETIDIAIRRLSAIEGRVIDEAGEPLEDVAVQAWRVRYPDGQLTVVPGGSQTGLTDDRGVYRLHGLLPGTYYVVAGQAASRGTTPLAPPLVFHPTGRSLPEATPIRLDGAFDAAGADVVFDTRHPPLARLEGRVVDETGEPLQGSVTLLTVHGSGVPRLPPRTVALDDRGRFDMPDVPPGEHVLHVVQLGLLAFPRQFARHHLRVDDIAVAPLDIRTSRGSTITGRIVLEGGTSPPVSGFLFEAVSADPDEAPAAPLTGLTADVRDRRPWAVIRRNDGSFEMGGLTGPLRFAALRAPEGWWLKSVELDGRNAVEDPVTFGAAEQSRHDLQVVFSDRGAMISARVTDAWQTPARRAAVVLFPLDRRLWFHRSPYMRRMDTNAQGEAVLSAMPPGDYWIVALDAADDEGWQQPEVLSTLAAAARQLTLREQDRVAVELRVVRGIMP